MPLWRVLMLSEIRDQNTFLKWGYEFIYQYEFINFKCHCDSNPPFSVRFSPDSPRMGFGTKVCKLSVVSDCFNA